jgi:seryl-tRNA synthetase
MSTLQIPLESADADYLSQVRYAMSFASEDIQSYDIAPEGGLKLTLRPGSDDAAIRDKVQRLLARYADRKFGFKEVVHFKQSRDLPVFDAWTALQEKKWITTVGPGHVVLRGPAARLMRAIDAKVLDLFATKFKAEHEVYPSTILCSTLDRIAHFTSFPEHVDFVGHLRTDVDVLGGFAKACREQGWKPEHHKDAMAPVDLAICPSCCYHCYEAMQGWRMPRPGRCVTAILECHRYEAGNLTSMSRLRSFTMREVVFVGHPEYVRSSRTAADELLVQWAKDWEIDCTFENANDMFFTDDFTVKASFQRQQEAKRELRLRIPAESKTIACASSNFHASTFAKAFDIQVDGRPATSACLGWGCQRWVYAIFSQFGLDEAAWPKAIREDLRRYTPEP